MTARVKALAEREGPRHFASPPPVRRERLAAGGHRLRRDQRERDEARLFAVVDLKDGSRANPTISLARVPERLQNVFTTCQLNAVEQQMIADGNASKLLGVT